MSILYKAYSPTNATVTEASTLILADVDDLNALELTNLDTTNTVYIALGNAAERNKGFVLFPRSQKTFSGGDVAANAIYGITEAGQTAVVSIGRG